ncbi:hypothetical protein HS125_17240 [bacterium]|nr:hypothetical protein [bacterium]
MPVDHAYALYSAVSRLVPQLHGDRTVGIHPVRGLILADRMQVITRSSRLILRLPAERIHEVLLLAGKRLAIGTNRLRVGILLRFRHRHAGTARLRRQPRTQRLSGSRRRGADTTPRTHTPDLSPTRQDAPTTQGTCAAGSFA